MRETPSALFPSLASPLVSALAPPLPSAPTSPLAFALVSSFTSFSRHSTERLAEAGAAHQSKDEQDQDQEDDERIACSSTKSGHGVPLLIVNLSESYVKYGGSVTIALPLEM